MLHPRLTSLAAIIIPTSPLPPPPPLIVLIITWRAAKQQRQLLPPQQMIAAESFATRAARKQHRYCVDSLDSSFAVSLPLLSPSHPLRRRYQKNKTETQQQINNNNRHSAPTLNGTGLQCTALLKGKY